MEGREVMLISHEIPKQLFPYQELLSDYPYILGHLLGKDADYSRFAYHQLKKAEFSILDNSAFELGASIDPENLYRLALDYTPKVLVLPDTLHDKDKTLKDSRDFYSKWNSNLTKHKVSCMGVLQGDSYSELWSCMQAYLELGLRYIALPFDCIKDSNWHTIRVQIWKQIVNDLDSATLGKVHFHFLGIENPSELLCYSEKELKFIKSIDTSSPIINGWLGNIYNDYGLVQPKPKVKLADSLDIKLSDNQVTDITHNVKKFKEYVGR